ncbi:MAG TPA: AMP-binding protein [Myxococcota bacterium]|nr:AMP-binding protein [Myxococcota bacterium]
MPDAKPPDLLAVYAAAQPAKTALIADGPGGRVLRWSYAELNARVNRLASHLLARGVRPGERVIWCGMNSPEVVAMTHAARKVGATAVPLNYRLAPEEAAYVVDDSDAGFVWADADHAELFAGIRDRTPKVRDVAIYGGPARPGQLDASRWLEEGSDAEPVPAGELLEASTMIYTSGTTGHPKGAVRRGSGDPQQVRALVEFIGYRPDDVYLSTGPLYHSGPGGFMGIAFALGNTVVLQRKFDPEDWLRLVATHAVTTTFSAPTPIRMVCNLPAAVKAKYDVGSMRRMIANAAPWSFALKQAYLADFPADSLFEVYGSTELGVNTILRPEDQLRKPGSCGRPAPGVDVKLVAEDGSEVRQPHVPGELFVRSRSVFQTYHKAEHKYEADRRGDFHTVGDVAYYDEEGFYFICDRKKDMIISGGMNIYPAEIEAALEAHPEVYDVAVIGIPSEEWGESVHAVVVPQPGASPSAEAIVAFARKHLAGYKVPRSVSFLSELPRTGSGKILKRVLREPFWEGHERRV